MGRPTRSEKKLTTAEFLAELAKRGKTLSRQRLHQLRRGVTQKKGGKEYFIEPKLRKGTDWWFEENAVYYSPTALEKID